MSTDDLKIFEDLKGKVLIQCENLDDEEILFVLQDRSKYKLLHNQDCCESVRIDDVCGDLKDLIDSEILFAEEVCSDDEDRKGVKMPDVYSTWTFYKLTTIKGAVTIRWLGESNGYYSETVDFEKVN